MWSRKQEAPHVSWFFAVATLGNRAQTYSADRVRSR
jgi:hypothetical protein